MDDVFMARGVQFSLENVRSGRGGPFDRVVVKKGDELAEGVNQVTTTNDPRAHAEVLAIREACQKLCCFELVSRMGATSGQEPLLKGYSQLHLKEDN
jgi:guanine deaminase